MPLPNDPASYSDCYDLYKRAIASRAGVQVVFPDQGKAKQFRHRMHKARSLSRELAKRVWPEDHPLHNTSEFYKIVIRIVFDGGRHLLRLEKRDAVNLEIEDIMPLEIVEENKLPEVVFEETGKLSLTDGFLTTPGTELSASAGENDEFDLAGEDDDLEPPRDLEPSPERTPRVRRL